MDFQKDQIRKLFEEKSKLKEVTFFETRQFFPDNIFEILKPYWEGELGRLLNPLPDLNKVLAELKEKVGFLIST